MKTIKTNLGLIFMMSILIIPFLYKDTELFILSLIIILLMFYFVIGVLLFSNTIIIKVKRDKR